jgi:hypothetical protein
VRLNSNEIAQRIRDLTQRYRQQRHREAETRRRLRTHYLCTVAATLFADDEDLKAAYVLAKAGNKEALRDLASRLPDRVSQE